jgi:hypothetical protein
MTYDAAHDGIANENRRIKAEAIARRCWLVGPEPFQVGGRGGRLKVERAAGLRRKSGLSTVSHRGRGRGNVRSSRPDGRSRMVLTCANDLDPPGHDCASPTALWHAKRGDTY